MKTIKQIALILLLLLSSAVFSETPPNIGISPLASSQTFAPGDTAIIALKIAIPEGYHLYANPMGPGVGKPVTITPKTVEGITWIGAIAQKPEKYIPEGMEEFWAWSWERSATLFVKGVVTASPNATVPVEISVDGLICKTNCIPVTQTVKLSLSIGTKSSLAFAAESSTAILLANAQEIPLEGITSTPDEPVATVDVSASNPPQWDYSPKSAGKSLNIVLALVFAFIAGLILNFMPCVLPVLGIKILSFSKGREGSKATALKHSFAFSLGMILVFMILATVAAFAGMSWGEQFQNPVFIVILVSMMFLFAMGMFDLFIILVPSKISEMDMKQDTNGFWGNFSKGVFATILATPCSGPFLGATLAWTLTQPKLVIYLVFLALGIGMASPYMLLAASKRLSRLVPKPGAWMETFKQILGFFLLGFAVYLMIGLPQDMVLPTVGMQVALAAAVILYTKVAPFGVSIGKKIQAGLMALAVIGIGYYITFEKMYGTVAQSEKVEGESTVTWQKFSVEAIQAAHAEGRPVMIDFTANWCMNCQFNKVNVYHSPEVEALIKEKNILAIKGDLTTDNAEIESLMHHLGSRSIPFLAIFDGKEYKTPVVMRDLVDKKTVMEELKKL